MAKGNNWHLPVRMWSRVGRLPHHHDGDDHNDYDRDDGDDHNDYDDQGLFHIFYGISRTGIEKKLVPEKTPGTGLD